MLRTLTGTATLESEDDVLKQTGYATAEAGRGRRFYGEVSSMASKWCGCIRP